MQRGEIPFVRVFAIALLIRGVHLKVVSDAMGHSKTAFTMNVYQAWLPPMGHLVADAIQAAIGEGVGR